MAGNIQYEVPTWNQIYDLLLCLAGKIRLSQYKPDVVVAVAKGGLVPARVLVDLLDNPEFAMIQVEFYADISQTKAEPVLKQGLAAPVAGKRALLVDDVADTGRSLQFAMAYLKNQSPAEVKTATLYHKPGSIVEPDFYEKQTANWVIFPWDLKETLSKILGRQGGRRQMNQEIARLIKSGLPKHLADKLLGSMQMEP